MRDRTAGAPAGSAPPLPAAEIEALLRIARENLPQSSFSASVEDIGPGDVQYLRGDSSTPLSLAIGKLPSQSRQESSGDTDALLKHVEQHLADAILETGTKPVFPLPSIDPAAKPVETTRNPSAQQGLTIEDLGDVDLDITIELGRTEILIEDILKLREGSVVSLDKLAGDPVDIIANGRLVARGELLVIDGKFGVRLSEVL